MTDHITDLVKETIDDATHLVHSEAAAAREKAEEIALASAAPTSIAAAGIMTAVLGSGLIVAAPALPEELRSLRRRMFVVGLLYIGGGVSAMTWGTRAVKRKLSASLESAKRELKQTGRAAKEGFEQAQS